MKEKRKECQLLAREVQQLEEHHQLKMQGRQREYVGKWLGYVAAGVVQGCEY